MSEEKVYKKIFEINVIFWGFITYIKQKAQLLVPGKEKDMDERERTCGIMANGITSIVDNLKQIFGMVYSESPTESYEESEENED